MADGVSVATLVAQGQTHLERDGYKDALACANSAISMDDAFAPAYSLKAKALYGLFDLDAAMKCFCEVILLNPRHTESYVELCAICLMKSSSVRHQKRQQWVDKARRCLEEAERLDPTSPSVRYARQLYDHKTNRANNQNQHGTTDETDEERNERDLLAGWMEQHLGEITNLNKLRDRLKPDSGKCPPYGDVFHAQLVRRLHESNGVFSIKAVEFGCVADNPLDIVLDNNIYIESWSGNTPFGNEVSSLARLVALRAVESGCQAALETSEAKNDGSHGHEPSCHEPGALTYMTHYTDYENVYVVIKKLEQLPDIGKGFVICSGVSLPELGHICPSNKCILEMSNSRMNVYCSTNFRYEQIVCRLAEVFGLKAKFVDERSRQ